MDCQIRCVWIIKVPSNSSPTKSTSWNDSNAIFHRKFPTGEKKAKQALGSRFIQLPSVSQFGPLILSELGFAVGDMQQFNPSRDSCGKPVMDPVFSVETREGTLWPLIAIDKSGYVFCCLPVVEVEALQELEERGETSIIEIPSIACGFALLTAIQDFLLQSNSEVLSRLADLPAFLNQAAPFGVVRDANVDNLMTRLSNKPCIVAKSHKLPAWKSSSHKGKTSLQLTVVERIKASQCAQETFQDSQDVYGSITCRAELEGSWSDVAVSIVNTGEGLGVPLDGLTVHPCVQRSDWQTNENTNVSKIAPRRLRFSPPNGQFVLCHYTVSKLTELPIFGVYQMKPEESKASINIVLKLSDQVKNNFELCELHIPFHTRSPISTVEGVPTQGSASLSHNRKVLIWNIGQKFASKDQTATLTATVTFSGNEQNLTAPTVEGAFCKGNNAYVQLYFKIIDFTHSGCHIDSKSIQVSPATKFKLNINREYSSSDYKIWNSTGEVLSVMGPT